MKPSDFTDVALDEELKRQRAVQRAAPEGSQAYLAAARIIYHLSVERQRRRLPELQEQSA